MCTADTARADLARPCLDAAPRRDSRAPPGFWSAITIATTRPVREATVEDTAEIVVGGSIGRLNGDKLTHEFTPARRW
jgi:hypothetical protein